MKKLTIKQLTTIRNSIIIGSIVIGLILWFKMPAMIKNTGMFHVGNGEYGTKSTVLVILLFPLFALVPMNEKIESHTIDATKKAKLEEECKKQGLWRQIGIALIELVVICICMMLGIKQGV